MARPRVEQFSGCLLGQCIGDALGFPVEGLGPEECAAYVAGVVRPRRTERMRRPPFTLGQYTDDSQLARELLQSYVAKRAFEPRDYAARIAAIFAQNRIVGRGLATQRAAQRLNAGVPWEQAGEPPPSAGNGTAMRAGPVGLIYYDDTEAMVRAATDQSRITHQDPRCAAGAAAVAGAVALALQGGSIDVETFVAELLSWVAPFETVFTPCLSEFPGWVHVLPADAAGPISQAGLTDDADQASPYAWEGISPYVVSSVLWSLYAFLRTPHDFWETICTAIEVGGDVDTTAAMAGAMSGAYNGLEALPRALVEAVNDEGTWAGPELIQLCEKAYAVMLRAKCEVRSTR